MKNIIIELVPDFDINTFKSGLAEEKDWLLEFVSEGLGGNEVQRLAIDLDHTLTALAVSNCGGGFLKNNIYINSGINNHYICLFLNYKLRLVTHLSSTNCSIKHQLQYSRKPQTVPAF